MKMNTRNCSECDKGLGLPDYHKDFVMYYFSKAAAEGNKAEFLGLGSGVTQGAVLGPVLFASYLDDPVERMWYGIVGCKATHA